MGSGFKTFTAGAVLTASDVNNYLMEQSIMYFATTAARDLAITSPEDGMVAYIGSNDSSEGLYSYHTAWRKGPGWNAPWGFIAETTLATSFTQSSTSAYDVTGMATTFTAISNRKYKVSAFMPSVYRAATVAVQFKLMNGATTLQLGTIDGAGTVDDECPVHLVTTQTFSAGSTTLKCSVAAAAGTGSMIVRARGGTPHLLIEDIGPSGAPS